MLDYTFEGRTRGINNLEEGTVVCIDNQYYFIAKYTDRENEYAVVSMRGVTHKEYTVSLNKGELKYTKVCSMLALDIIITFSANNIAYNEASTGSIVKLEDELCIVVDSASKESCVNLLDLTTGMLTENVYKFSRKALDTSLVVLTNERCGSKVKFKVREE